jgi:very-short-patch-repair endonuclease
LTFRRSLRVESSQIEKVLWECLRNRRFHQLKFRPQHSIGPYVADFFCEALSLVVEADGPAHFDAAQARHDRERDIWMTRRGLLVVRLPYDEVLTAPELALKRVVAVLSNRGVMLK